MKKNNNGIKWLIILLALMLAALLFYIWYQHSQMTEMVEQMSFEKEQLQDEYEDLVIQFDGYQNIELKNDSLQSELARERQRVQDLLEELRVTKVTNARKIAALKKELATVRTIMQGYVAQIDSLNRTNERLSKENTRYREQYRTVSRQAEQLQQEKTQLTEVVQRASMLEITHFEFTPLNNRDHKTRFVSKMVKFQFDFTLAKNITCEPGVKTMYLRVIDPQGELMLPFGVTAETAPTFDYESGEVPYSAMRELEYAGEEMSDHIYLSLSAEPAKGIYNAEFFIDGNLIGTFPFKIGK